MARVLFSYNLDKDLFNYLRSIYQFKWLKHGRKNIEKAAGRYLFPEEISSIQRAKNEKTAREVIQDLLKEKLNQNKSIYSLSEMCLKKAWKPREKTFFSLLTNFYEKPIYFSSVTAYFTTLPICPYNRKEGWFMVSFHYGLEKQIQTICHELMHFMFLNFYWNYAFKNLKSGPKAEILKEALTVFLNTEFRQVNTIYDPGYPQEKDLRNLLLKTRLETHSFQELLDAAIKFLR